ncbi:hypothetical protein [uncultured Microbulbifer sp.]|uniref:hypothetical protein n=1 Tax=uncultured Microbulbifer sp. TaxID=348147 RepID=UPI00262EC321|nr:hypothetical protein [uncultured Microbulbifer sp.]
MTPEIKEAIATQANYLLATYGIVGLITLIIVGFILNHLSKKYVDQMVEEGIREYQSELDKKTLKTTDIWKFKKEVTFEFMKFMDENMFLNPKLNSADGNEKAEEEKRVFREFNLLYAKLFVVFDTPMIDNINTILNGPVSEIQRFYLYREIRNELQGYLNDDKADPDDCPYINREIANILTPERSGSVNTFDKLKEIYPFIEAGATQSKIKGIPFYGVG